MSEWWTYSLSDFLMFSARTYYRQFALLNRDLWPLQLVALAAGAVILACMLRKRQNGARIVFALLAAAWAWVGWAYHLQRYADINTAAPYFAAGFFVQAAMLAWIARRPREPSGRDETGPVLLLVLALLYPALTQLDGHDWWQAEVVGFAPDPTAVATMSALLYWRAPRLLWAIPVLWCLASSATLRELHAARAGLPASLALLALAMTFRRLKLRR